MSSWSSGKSPYGGWHSVEVTCYSGQIHAERPVSFNWKGTEYRVVEIEKTWLEPGERHFRVKAGDNKRFRLCYNMTQDLWSLMELQRG